MKRNRIQVGFTLLEMLTALAIIAVMIGLLIPAIGKIQDTAHTVKQKAQFSGIEIALETFSTDTGDYPPSSYTGAGAMGYSGAQKIAEAIVGLDGFGFHPKSQWQSNGTANVTGKDGTAMPNTSIYHIGADIANFETADENFKARKGPYLELEKANAVKVSSVYKFIPTVNPDTFILADMFGKVKNKTTGRSTGMPILYFRADSSKFQHYPTDFLIPTDSIYNVSDNNPFIMSSVPWDSSVINPMGIIADNGPKIFYDRTANPNFTAPQRPYRATSFILLSAGADGVYGSADDVYNIDENEK